MTFHHSSSHQWTSQGSCRSTTSENHSAQILLNAAHRLTGAGISVVAADRDKTPIGGKWKPFQKRIATDSELYRMFSQPRAEAIAIIGGRVSGNLITLDFEGKDHNHKKMPSVYQRWVEMAKAELNRLGHPDLFETIPIVQTRKHGYHVRWRVSGEIQLGNEQLAKRWARHPETGEILTDEHGAPIADLLIESKGEGGLTLCPPSPGYQLRRGDLKKIPILPVGIHEMMISLAKSLHTAIDEKSRFTSCSHESKRSGGNTTSSTNQTDSEGLKPGDDYNQRGDWRKLLFAEGWELARESGGQEYFKRPGTTHQWSATFSPEHNTLYVFSSNASPFEADRAYSPFAIYTLFNHSGDFSAAAKDLAAQGFGSSFGHNGNKKSNAAGNGHNGNASNRGGYAPFTETSPPGGNGNGRNGGGNGNNSDKGEPADSGGENRNDPLLDAFLNAREKERLDPRPPVLINNRQMRHLIEDTQEIIQAYDGEPLIYQKNGRLLRVKFCDDRPVLDYFTPDTLTVTLNEYADFYRTRQTKQGVTFTPTPPPAYLAKGILHAPRHHVPKLEFVSASPVFAPDGSVAKTEGYNPKVSAFLHLQSDMQISDSEIDPTEENIETSKALIEEMIAEFPFEGEASRQNAISLLLTPFLRPIIDAEIPLYVCDSSDPGTGKGLLIDSLLTPYLSHRPISNSEVSGDEWRKQLTTLLEHNPDVIYFDNAQKLDSSALASALTKGVWQDRRLGKNELITSEIRAIFVVNGNNVEISGENARRVVWIRMVPNTEDPEEREFRIADLRRWVSDHRRELVVAALTLINNWVKGGMMPGNLRMGSFEKWAQVLGGVMAANGYDQFMQNVPQLKSRVDKTREAMREFVTAWYDEYQTQQVNASQLLHLASIEFDEAIGEEVGQGILSELLTSNSRRGRANQLRNLLRKNTDRTFRLGSGDSDGVGVQCKIVSTNKRQNGYMVYQLIVIHPDSEPPFDSDSVHSESGSRFTDNETNNDGGYSDSSEPGEPGEPQAVFQEKTAGEEKEKETAAQPEEKGGQSVETQNDFQQPHEDEEKGSLEGTRFTSDASNLDGNSVWGQVNLEGDRDDGGSLHSETDTGSLSPDASHYGTPNPDFIERRSWRGQHLYGEGISAVEAQAVEYVRSWLTSQVNHLGIRIDDELSSYQVAFIREEANRQFGTDLVEEDIEAIWERVGNTSMPTEP